MATLQTINIGNLVNDGLGDDLRTAFQKVNSNFAQLNSELTVTVSNAGTSGEGLVKDGLGPSIELKRLSAGDKIELTGFTDSIQIKSTAKDAFTTLTGNWGGSITADEDATPIGTNNIVIQGATSRSSVSPDDGRNIRIYKTSANTLMVDTVLDLNVLLQTYDFGYTAATDYDNPIQALVSLSNMDFGTITNPGRFNLNLGAI